MDANTVQEHLRELKALVHDSLKQWNLSTDTEAATSLAGMSNPTRMANGNQKNTRQPSLVLFFKAK